MLRRVIASRIENCWTPSLPGGDEPLADCRFGSPLRAFGAEQAPSAGEPRASPRPRRRGTAFG